MATAEHRKLHIIKKRRYHDKINNKRKAPAWCRGRFEATAIVEKLAAYENLEEDEKLYNLYNCDEMIHPKMVSKLFGIDMKAAVELLEDLLKKGFL